MEKGRMITLLVKNVTHVCEYVKKTSYLCKPNMQKSAYMGAKTKEYTY